jgi:toxin ParE1/3/4
MTGYTISPLAQADLDEIWDYVAKDSPSAADRLLARFRAKFVLLAGQPLLGEVRDELRPGVRSFVVGKYVIYYQVAGNRIRVVRILHGYRDVNALFSDPAS